MGVRTADGQADNGVAAQGGTPLRVLHVVTFMNVGGLECRLMDVYRRMNRAAVQYDFYCCSPAPSYFDDEIISLGGRVFHGPRNRVMDVLRRKTPLYRFLLAHPEYSIVHCHLNQWCGMVLRGAKRAGVPVRIAHSHTALPLRGLRNVVKAFIKTSVNRHATHRFAVSPQAGAWLFGKKAQNGGRVAVLPNAIDVQQYRFNPQTRAQMRQTLGLTDEIAVLHVGNHRVEKNQPFLLDIFDAFVAAGHKSRLLQVGKPAGGGIEAYARAKPCRDSVTFLGTRRDVPALLPAADVFVFPSLSEGFPGAVLEAQACGLPCVVSDVIGENINVTGLVTRLSLRRPPSDWVRAMEASLTISRADHAGEVMDAGYDIGLLAARLLDMYTQMAGAQGERAM